MAGSPVDGGHILLFIEVHRRRSRICMPEKIHKFFIDSSKSECTKLVVKDYTFLLKTEIVFNRLLVREARRLAANYHLKYEEHIPTSQLVQQVASVMQEYTQQGFVCLCYSSSENFIALFLKIVPRMMMTVDRSY